MAIIRKVPFFASSLELVVGDEVFEYRALYSEIDKHCDYNDRAYIVKKENLIG